MRRALGDTFTSALAGLAEGAAAEAATACLDCSVMVRAPGPAGAVSTGGFSPGATIHAMVFPTGITSPADAVTPASTPSAVASTSSTTLSVSISAIGSPLAIESPSCFSHEMSLPVSCAISSAGMTMLTAI
jgi:hypothetical protein